MTIKIDRSPGKADEPAQKKPPFSMGLPPLVRMSVLRPKHLWEKLPAMPPAAKT